jgi:hypothetical protein
MYNKGGQRLITARPLKNKPPNKNHKKQPHKKTTKQGKLLYVDPPEGSGPNGHVMALAGPLPDLREWALALGPQLGPLVSEWEAWEGVEFVDDVGDGDDAGGDDDDDDADGDNGEAGVAGSGGA